MSDLVERLRNDQGVGINLTLCREAADEIERLRVGGCARNQRTTQWCAEAVDANARATAAEARAVEAEQELAQCRKEKNDLVLKAYPAMDERDDLRRSLLAAQKSIEYIIRHLSNREKPFDVRISDADSEARFALSNLPAPAPVSGTRDATNPFAPLDNPGWIVPAPAPKGGE